MFVTVMDFVGNTVKRFSEDDIIQRPLRIIEPLGFHKLYSGIFESSLRTLFIECYNWNPILVVYRLSAPTALKSHIYLR